MAKSEKRFNFTQKELAKVVCPPTGRAEKDGRVYVYDAQVPGLAYCVTETGAKSFYLCRMVAGKSKRMKLGLASDLPIERARTLAGRLIAEIVTGKDPVTEKAKQRAEAAKTVATFGDLWMTYKTEYLLNNAMPRTVKEFARIYETHLSGWSSRPLTEITSEQCEALKVSVAAKGHYMANRVLELISAMFRRCGKRFGLPKNYSPTADVEHYDERPRDRVLSNEELARVFASIDADDNETAKVFFRMLIYTGARKNNVATMRWSDLHREGKQRVWKLAGELMKNGDPLTIALVPDAVAILDRRASAKASGAEYVFPANRPTLKQVDEAKRLQTDGKTTREIADALNLSQTSVVRMLNPDYTAKGEAPFGGSAKAWKRILERAKVKDATIHDLRRTYCTNLIEAGVPIPIVAAIMGHKTIATTERAYTHVRKATASAAALAGFVKVMENVRLAGLPNV